MGMCGRENPPSGDGYLWRLVLADLIVPGLPGPGGCDVLLARFLAVGPFYIVVG